MARVRVWRYGVAFLLVLGSSLLFLLLVQVLSAQPQLPHTFSGSVKVGSEPAGSGLEIRVKALDVGLNALVTLEFTFGSVNTTNSSGDYLFAVRADNPDTAEREGGKPGERLFFFLLTRDGTGDAALVQAATNPAVVLFEIGGSTKVNLSIFGPPTNIRCEVTPGTGCISLENFSNNPRPTFTWGPPATGDVVSFEARIDQDAFVDIGNVTTFIGDAVADGPHTFRVRAVGTGDRKDAVGSLDFFIDTIAATTPRDLADATTGDELVRIFEWTRSVDPGSPDTGSGVDFYSIAITGPQNVVATADDSASACPDDVCVFTTPPLRTGDYTIEVIAVDRATNESVPAVFNVFDVQISLEPAILLAVQNEPVDLTIRIDPIRRSVDGIDVSIDFLEPLQFDRVVSLTAGVTITSIQTTAQTLDFEAVFVARSTSLPNLLTFRLNPNPPKDTDGRREDSGRGWVRELQGRWPGVLG